MKNLFQVSSTGDTDSISQAESIVANYQARYPGLRIMEGPTHPGAEAQYTKEFDAIVIKPEWDRDFEGSRENWFRALFHELTHSTGHPSRNNRDMGASYSSGYEDRAYCIEELTAELGSSFLTEECGMYSTRVLHTHYLQHYIWEMNATPSVVVHAAEQAAEAAQLILGRDCKAVGDALRLVA